jgi:1-acyl-sn-glycerol-3-phosphate acyltransferase
MQPHEVTVYSGWLIPDHFRNTNFKSRQQWPRLITLLFGLPSTKINLCFKIDKIGAATFNSMVLYIAKLALAVIITLPIALVTMVLGLFDPHGKYVYGITRFWSSALLALGRVSVQVHGLDRLDTRERYLFMANHQSNVDIPVLVHGLPGFQLRWIAKKELLRVPFFGWALQSAKHIIVNRADRTGARAVLTRAAQRMANGISVVVFPEGTRSADGHLLPFKRGGFVLAVKTNAPIVPVTISGSYKLLPRGEWRLRPGTIHVYIGEAIATGNTGRGELRALVTRVRRTIEANLPIDTDTTTDARAAMMTSDTLEARTIRPCENSR